MFYEGWKSAVHLPSLAHLLDRVQTQHAITLRLGLIEELVGCALVRKVLIDFTVGYNIRRLGPAHDRFNVNEKSVLAHTSSFVADGAHSPALLASAQRLRPAFLKLDVHFGVNTDFAQCIAQIAELEFAVSSAIEHNDVTAASLHHLLYAEIVEVSAIGEINVWTFFIRQPKRFAHQRIYGGARALFTPGGVPGRAGIAQPRSQPRIQQRHDESQNRWREI